MPPKPQTIDAYLAALPDDQRAALEKVRKAIRAAAPGAEEGFSYGMPAFRLDGKPIAGFAAAAKHCSYFPMSGSVVETLKDDLARYDTSKGTIRFPANRPLPAALVRKLVNARVAEIGANAKKPGPAGRAARPARSASLTDPAVDAFMAKLDHPMKKELESLRQVIRGVSPETREGIKWNAPSFRTTDDFATFNLRGGQIRLILHTGATAKGLSLKGAIPDPANLLDWLADDRALVTFADARDVREKKKALAGVVREWSRRVNGTQMSPEEVRSSARRAGDRSQGL